MTKLILRGAMLLAASFVLGTHGATAAEDAKPAETPPMTIYDTALAADWDNWSWAKTDLGVELGGSTRRPIRVAAKGWEALYLHHAPFSTTGLKRLSFLIESAIPDREVRVFAIVEGKNVGEGKLVKISNTGWTDVKIPLVNLGVEDKTIDGFWVQNASQEELPKFYVTEIKLD